MHEALAIVQQEAPAALAAQVVSADEAGEASTGSPIVGIVISLAILMLMLHVLFWYRARGRLQQAARHHTLFQELPEAVVLTDFRWKIVETNEAAATLLGLSQDQASLMTLKSLIETKTELEPPAIREAFRGGKEITFEARIEREKEEPIELAARTRRIHLEDQTYLLTVFNDITEYKGHQRLFKTFHRRLVEDLPIEVVVLGPQGQYLYANPKAIPNEELREYMMGETDVEYAQYLGLHPEIALLRRSHRRRAVSTKAIISFEETLPGPDGGYRTFTRIYSPVIDQQGQVTAVVSYGVETTELKSYQDEIVAVREEAERVMEMKEAFLANISHEFRTPLTGILGFAQLLQEDVEPGSREFVDIILRNGRRLMATLNAMVDLSKLHSNYLEMHPTVFNMVEEVKQVAQSVSGLAQEKNLYLRLRATRPEVLVRLDRSHLFRVLENLIGNAIKFTNQGGVIVEVSSDSEHAYVHVMDTGVGIRNEFLPFLFEEFNQESSGLSRHFEGTGIGLTVVKRLLDMMGASISVDSEKGEGSTFTIVFPIAFPQARSGMSTRSRLLLADGSEEVHTLVEYVLSPYFDVHYAKDFHTAVQQASENEYDIVLMDPEISEASSAAEALAPIRHLRGYEKVPVVALDPHPVHGGEVHFLAAGYDECLQKPIDKQLLLDALGHLLSGEKRRPRRGRAEKRPQSVA